jgi:hypothetical protein
MREPPIPAGDDPELARLGQAFRDEVRAEAQAYEALAAQDHLRRRRLADVALELLHRGDRVTVHLPGAAFSGEVVDAAANLCTLATAAGRVDLRLDAVLEIVVTAPSRSGGRSRAAGTSTFLARLREHEASGALVEVGAAERLLEGRIAAVAEDHLVLDGTSGLRRYVALPAIAWVRVPTG